MGWGWGGGSGHSTQYQSLHRAACQKQAVTVTLQEDRASLSLSDGASTLHFVLSKVPGTEAAPRLQALTLSLAQRVCSLEQQLAGSERAPLTLTRLPLPMSSFLAFLPRCRGENLQPQEELPVGRAFIFFTR